MGCSSCATGGRPLSGRPDRRPGQRLPPGDHCARASRICSIWHSFYLGAKRVGRRRRPGAVCIECARQLAPGPAPRGPRAPKWSARVRARVFQLASQLARRATVSHNFRILSGAHESRALSSDNKQQTANGKHEPGAWRVLFNFTSGIFIVVGRCFQFWRKIQIYVRTSRASAHKPAPDLSQMNGIYVVCHWRTEFRCLGRAPLAPVARRQDANVKRIATCARN